MAIQNKPGLAASLALALILAVPAQGFCAEAAAAQGAAADETMSSSEVLQAIKDLGGDAAVDLSKVIEKIFAESGRPTAVIVGSEAQGSFIVGYRKGSGKLVFKGQSAANAEPLFWRAPSFGINVGASVSKVAVLVYGAKNRDELLRRFASVEGSYHLLAGASVSYLRSSLDPQEKGAINLAYVTVGVGVDAGVAVESLTFSKKSVWGLAELP
jgi:hypothetical protein